MKKLIYFILILGILFVGCTENSASPAKSENSSSQTNSETSSSPTNTEKIQSDKLTREDALKILKDSKLNHQPVKGALTTLYIEHPIDVNHPTRPYEENQLLNTMGELKAKKVIYIVTLNTIRYGNTDQFVHEYKQETHLTDEGKKYLETNNRNGETLVRTHELEIEKITGMVEEIPNQKVKVEYTLIQTNPTPFSILPNYDPIKLENSATLVKYDDGWRVQ